MASGGVSLIVIVDFVLSSRRPVINAMSGKGHPCEVLADAWFIHSQLVALDRARIVGKLWRD